VKALERLRQGQPVFGLFQTFPDATLTELAVWCGYDFVILDCEHGVVDESAQLQVLRVICGSDAFSLVRVRPGDDSAVARYLDFGADGVLVPDVRTPDQARQIGFAANGRWTGGLRGDRYGLGPASQGKRKPLVIVLIESAEGVHNVEAILDVAEIDGAIVGSGDLSTNLGSPGDFTSPAYVSANERVERAARERGKILGAKPYATFSIPILLERGHRLILVGRDVAFIKNGLVEALAAARRSLST
jgi:4-hydroxy-2-oxoheptanedioate aldolase